MTQAPSVLLERNQYTVYCSILPIIQANVDYSTLPARGFAPLFLSFLTLLTEKKQAVCIRGRSELPALYSGQYF